MNRWKKFRNQNLRVSLRARRELRKGQHILPLAFASEIAGQSWKDDAVVLGLVYEGSQVLRLRAGRRSSKVFSDVGQGRIALQALDDKRMVDESPGRWLKLRIQVEGVVNGACQNVRDGVKALDASDQVCAELPNHDVEAVPFFLIRSEGDREKVLGVQVGSYIPL